MKKIIAITLLSILTTFNSSYAQKMNINAAVINVEAVLKNSIAMKQIQKKISKKETAYQAQIDKQQKSLEKELKKIQSKKSVLSKEALKKEEEKFVKKFNDLKKDLEIKQKSLKTAYTQSISKLDKKINEIVSRISEEKDIDLIAPSSGLIAYGDQLDISPEVLSILNKEMKTIKVNFN